MALASTFETRVSPGVRAYAQNISALADSRIRLTTGNRLVRSGDDPAAVTVSTTLNTQTSLLRNGLVSGAKATSFLQIAYDGLSQIRTILDSLVDFTAQANNPGRTTLSYAVLDAQFQSGLSDIDRVVAATTFGGASILDGSVAAAVPVGDSSSDTVTLTIPDLSVTALFGATPPNLSGAVAAAAATTPVDDASQLVDEAIAKVDAYLLQLTIADSDINQRVYGVGLGYDALAATDEDAETRDIASRELRQNTAAAILAQASGLNSGLLHLISARS